MREVLPATTHPGGWCTQGLMHHLHQSLMCHIQQNGREGGAWHHATPCCCCCYACQSILLLLLCLPPVVGS